MSVGRSSVTLRKALPHLVHISLKHEQPIGVAIGIGEVVLLALSHLHLQVLVLIVDRKRLEIFQRHLEAIVFVARLVAQSLWCRDELTGARSDAMFVDDGE